jgi:hypothetical protein
MATSKAKKPFHLIRITKEIFNDLMIWKMFVENFNGTSFILDDTWLSNFDMQLFSSRNAAFISIFPIRAFFFLSNFLAIDIALSNDEY